jgi:hypothetical protein
VYTSGDFLKDVIQEQSRLQFVEFLIQFCGEIFLKGMNQLLSFLGNGLIAMNRLFRKNQTVSMDFCP